MKFKNSFLGSALVISLVSGCGSQNNGASQAPAPQNPQNQYYDGNGSQPPQQGPNQPGSGNPNFQPSGPQNPQYPPMGNPNNPNNGPINYPNNPNNGPINYPNNPNNGPINYPNNPNNGPINYPNNPNNGPINYPNNPNSGPINYPNNPYVPGNPNPGGPHSPLMPTPPNGPNQPFGPGPGPLPMDPNAGYLPPQGQPMGYPQYQNYFQRLQTPYGPAPVFGPGMANPWARTCFDRRIPLPRFNDAFYYFSAIQYGPGPRPAPLFVGSVTVEMVTQIYTQYNGFDIRVFHSHYQRVLRRGLVGGAAVQEAFYSMNIQIDVRRYVVF